MAYGVVDTEGPRLTAGRSSRSPTRSKAGNGSVKVS